MEKFIVEGGNRLTGQIKVSGAKNVAMKVILAGLLTDKPIYVKNIPLISSIFGTIEIVKPLGVKVKLNKDHTMTIIGDRLKSHVVPLELGGLYRTATMVMGPLLSRLGKATVPNPGGCRIGKRPIDRHIDGLKALGAKIKYQDGYFMAETNRLYGTRYRFVHNTHTGTESMILAAVLAQGQTILENAACEPEIDDLVLLLNMMGAKIRRRQRTIAIDGVKELRGTEFSVMPDRNEVVTFAIAAIATKGEIVIEGTQSIHLKSFLRKLDEVNTNLWEPISETKTRFYNKDGLRSVGVTTAYHPGFMTDWQAPWAFLMTQAEGVSSIHETIYEDRFSYVSELCKMGAKIEFYSPKVSHPHKFYNFNWDKKNKNKPQAIKIFGPTNLHNAVLEVSDLRAGATLLLAGLAAEGESVVLGVEHIDRGYEEIEKRLAGLGGNIKRLQEN